MRESDIRAREESLPLIGLLAVMTVAIFVAVTLVVIAMTILPGSWTQDAVVEARIHADQVEGGKVAPRK